MKRDGDRIRQQCDEDRTVHYICLALFKANFNPLTSSNNLHMNFVY